MMFSTSSSGKRSGISPKRRGHVQFTGLDFVAVLEQSEVAASLFRGSKKPLPREKPLCQVSTSPGSREVAQVILLKNKHS